MMISSVVYDAALYSSRNGLFLNQVIEKSWNNGWAVIVPDETVNHTPTKWKIILLNESVRNDMMSRSDEGEITRWKDFDEQKLKFFNENRPARRYLYLKYVMTYLHAEKPRYSNFKEKVPNGTMWASPKKQDGYFRKSVLRILTERVGNTTLPIDLIAAETFVDTESNTGRSIKNIKAGIELFARIKKKEKSNLKNESENETDEDEDWDEILTCSQQCK